MAKVSDLKFGAPGTDRGSFHVETFNLFEQDDADNYAQLRTRANDASSGIQIEHIQQFARKTSTAQGDGEDRVVITTEEMHIVVQYWEKPIKRDKGDSEDDVKNARREWSMEREATT